MRVDRGTHWHGDHPKGLNNPADVNVRRWRQVLDAQAPMLKEMGVSVINASPVSALEAYPKMTLEAAINGEMNVAA